MKFSGTFLAGAVSVLSTVVPNGMNGVVRSSAHSPP